MDDDVKILEGLFFETGQQPGKAFLLIQGGNYHADLVYRTVHRLMAFLVTVDKAFQDIETRYLRSLTKG